MNFTFQSDEAYAQITKPLKDLLKNDAKFIEHNDQPNHIAAL